MGEWRDMVIRGAEKAGFPIFTPYYQLTDEQKNVVAHFKNPAMPSVAATTDAALKIATAREGFADTDVFLEMIGFDKADIRRIRAQETRARGLATLNEMGIE